MTEFKYHNKHNTPRYFLLPLFCVFLFLFLSILWYYPQLDRWINLQYTSDRFTTIRLGYNQRLQGEIIQEQNVSLARFLGVPYADTPKRFQKPLPHPGWSGNRAALSWPPYCMQKPITQYQYLTKLYTEEVSEDCLYLNIWTPHKNLTNSGYSSELLPVVVFIHGGAFRYMGISMEAHEGSIYSAIGNVIFVAMNYRAGLFGFLDTDVSTAGYSKNVGLYDQEMALRWVAQHIRAFGGDPEQITIQGQSAGAISAGLHMLSQRTNKLFQRTIMQSGSPMMAKQLFSVKGTLAELLRLTGCNTTSVSNQHSNDNDVEYDDEHGNSDDSATESPETEFNNDTKDRNNDALKQLQCLERIDASELDRIQEKIYKLNFLSFSPTIPSDFITEFPAFDSNPIIFQKSVLLGADANETGLFLHHTFPDDYPLQENLTIPKKTVMKTLKHYIGNPDVARSMMDNLLQHGNFERFFAFLNDFSFKGPVLKFAKFLEQRSTPTYLYMFNEPNKQYPKWIGASHWLEMDYVFGIPLRYPHRFTLQQQDLSRRIIKNFAYFAKTGKTLPQLGVEWPEYSSEKNEHMILKAGRASLGTGLDMTFYSLFDLTYDAS